MHTSSKSTVRDMTEGSIISHLIGFSIPLLIGNVFQMLYNTVDSIVVGNFVGKQALAAISSTTMIVNIMIFFFNGFSIGGGVVISRYFGARKMEDLHRAVETAIAVTILFGIFFTFAGFFMVPVMLGLMSTPDDVFPEAKVYLEIYFSGALGLLIYNMGSGILRAVGDTKRPLYFLIFTSILNTVLDLVFVIVFRTGIAGAAFATILSQFLSAFLVLMLLWRTDDIYKLTWHDLRIDLSILKNILEIGLPAGLQSMITSVSNVFVQSYINGFGCSLILTASAQDAWRDGGLTISWTLLYSCRSIHSVRQRQHLSARISGRRSRTARMQAQSGLSPWLSE